MRKLKVDMAELAMAFENASLELSYYLDVETGQVSVVTDEMHRHLEDIYEEVFDEEGKDQTPFAEVLEQLALPAWMTEALQEADRIEAGFGTRYLKVPGADSREGYQDMEDFIATVENQRLQDRLWRAIKGRGAFGRFKEVLASVPAERERWFQVKDARVRQRVLDWLASADIEVLEE